YFSRSASIRRISFEYVYASLSRSMRLTSSFALRQPAKTRSAAATAEVRERGARVMSRAPFGLDGLSRSAEALSNATRSPTLTWHRGGHRVPNFSRGDRSERMVIKGALERTLVLVKPDGVQRHLVGRILTRFEEKGLRIAALKMVRVSRELAETHYGA